MSNFYLISTESIRYEPRKCIITKRLKTEIRDDLACVLVEPPIHKDIYNTEEDIAEIILAARFEGSSLFPITEWPLYVYICRIKKNSCHNTESIAANDVTILDWGAIYPTFEDAQKAIEE